MHNAAVPVDQDPDRAHQIRRLFRLGMSLEAATTAVDGDRITLALLDHLIGGSREFTRVGATARAGVDERWPRPSSGWPGSVTGCATAKPRSTTSP